MIIKYEPLSKSDIVLLDAPCTGTGTFRKSQTYGLKIKDIKVNANYQKNLIIQALIFKERRNSYL